jgi:hypothetical protein
MTLFTEETRLAATSLKSAAHSYLSVEAVYDGTRERADAWLKAELDAQGLTADALMDGTEEEYAMLEDMEERAELTAGCVPAYATMSQAKSLFLAAWVELLVSYGRDREETEALASKLARLPSQLRKAVNLAIRYDGK